jgi:hypothetical protein
MRGACTRVDSEAHWAGRVLLHGIAPIVTVQIRVIQHVRLSLRYKRLAFLHRGCPLSLTGLIFPKFMYATLCWSKQKRTCGRDVRREHDLPQCSVVWAWRHI